MRNVMPTSLRSIVWNGLVVEVPLNGVDDGKEARFDELNQPFEHLRLAGEVPIERRFRNIQPGCECGCGDLLAFRILQHLRERLQNLQLALAGFGPHRRPLVPFF